MTGEAAQRDKRIANARAQAALRGFEIHIVDRSGTATFIVAKWGMSHELLTLEGLEDWLSRAVGSAE
ncbi:hypothetical protein [Piscinibacter sp.]|uniref:hypothetical protein n=1 Tax=Piscinibacter sp. TaxID=1903157 RepID=UPI002CDF3173|nr:hypothetical protein [Albitalea sp.]HUG26221.1 hypothetical protein [Albitalea sp.]